MKNYVTSNYEENIMPRLFIEVMNAGSEELKSRPHRIILDVAIACRVDMVDHSVPVTNEMLKEYEGVTSEEIVREAILNSPNIKPEKFGKVNQVLGPENKAKMYFLSTKGFGSATSLFYPWEMGRIEYKLGGGYVVIPSSVHEVLVFPDDGITMKDAEDLSRFIKSVNEDKSCISPDEILSWVPYHYSDGVFETLESYLLGKR